MVASDDEILKAAHIHQIPWLGDDNAIILLIEMLADVDNFVSHLALSTLNAIEHRNHDLGTFDELPCSLSDYVSRKNDAEFINLMVHNLTEWFNAAV